MNPPALPATTVQVKSSAIKAGWICLPIGLCTFWIFGFGFLFFSVSIILAIVGMCTNQVKQGVILLVSSVVAMGLCVLLFFMVVLGTFGAIGMQVQKDMERQMLTTPRPIR